MKKIILAILAVVAVGVTMSAKAVTYSCPSGGTLSGSTCVVPATYYCPAANGGGTLSGTNCLNATITPAKNCNFSGSMTSQLFAPNRFSMTVYDASVTCPSATSTTGTLFVNVNPSYQCHGGGCNSTYFGRTLNITYGTSSSASYANTAQVYTGAWWKPIGISYGGANSATITVEGGSFVFTFTGSGYSAAVIGTIAATILTPSSSYPATVTYQCNAGDTLFQNTSGVWQCQPPSLTTTAVTNYACTDQDGNGAIDSFVAGTSKTKCRPDILAYTGEPVWYCPVVSGDPDQIVAGTVAWSLDGSLQNATGYTVTGPLGAPIASSMKWVGGTTCSYQPPTVDGLYAYTTRHCTDPTHVLDATGMFCIPPKTPTSSTLTTPMACSGSDVLNGSTCTPVLQTYQAAMTTTYACPSTLPSGTVLDPTTHLCHVPMITQPPTPVSTLVCGSNAKLNATTGQCDYVSIPAVNVGGSYSCPAGYTIGTGANVGWCIPTPSWAYPAAWDWKQYSCPDGGTLGLDANGNPNGLCYLP